jgi:hypothetical protein
MSLFLVTVSLGGISLFATEKLKTSYPPVGFIERSLRRNCNSLKTTTTPQHMIVRSIHEANLCVYPLKLVPGFVKFLFHWNDKKMVILFTYIFNLFTFFLKRGWGQFDGYSTKSLHASGLYVIALLISKNKVMGYCHKQLFVFPIKHINIFNPLSVQLFQLTYKGPFNNPRWGRWFSFLVVKIFISPPTFSAKNLIPPYIKKVKVN